MIYNLRNNMLVIMIICNAINILIMKSISCFSIESFKLGVYF